MMNASFPDLRGEHRTEAVPPAPDRLVADIDATFEQQIFDLPQRQRIADLYHHREADYLGRAVEVTEWIAHPQRLRAKPAGLNPICSGTAAADTPVAGAIIQSDTVGQRTDQPMVRSTDANPPARAESEPSPAWRGPRPGGHGGLPARGSASWAGAAVPSAHDPCPARFVKSPKFRHGFDIFPGFDRLWRGPRPPNVHSRKAAPRKIPGPREYESSKICIP